MSSQVDRGFWAPQRIGKVHNTFVTVVESYSNAKLIDVLSGGNLQHGHLLQRWDSVQGLMLFGKFPVFQQVITVEFVPLQQSLQSPARKRP